MTLWTVANSPSPTRLLCPWDFSGENTGVHCHFPPAGDLPNLGIKTASSESPTLKENSLPTEPSGKPLQDINKHQYPIMERQDSQLLFCQGQFYKEEGIIEPVEVTSHNSQEMDTLA